MIHNLAKEANKESSIIKEEQVSKNWEELNQYCRPSRVAYVQGPMQGANTRAQVPDAKHPLLHSTAMAAAKARPILQCLGQHKAPLNL